MNPSIIPKSQVRVLRAYGDEVAFHLDSAHNGGAFAMFTDITPPGGGPPPHFHVAEDEWFFVLDGKAEFFDGEKWIPVSPGGSVYMPKNSLHAFRNAGDQPLKQIIHTSPGGFEAFFRESEAVFAANPDPDICRLLEIGAEHGIHFPTMASADTIKCARPTLPSVIVQPGEGSLLRAFGEEVTVMLDGRKTGGQCTSFTETTPPGGGPPPHFHEREDEWFYVLEGCVSFFVEGKWTDANAGDVVFTPRQSVHTFKNNGDQPTRMLIHTSPSGFETFFAEAAEEFARPGAPDLNRATAIANKHGIYFVGE